MCIWCYILVVTSIWGLGCAPQGIGGCPRSLKGKEA
nr:MAG TPA: hypothetical protein [Bacteriophage sp.]